MQICYVGVSLRGMVLVEKHAKYTTEYLRLMIMFRKYIII